LLNFIDCWKPFCNFVYLLRTGCNTLSNQSFNLCMPLCIYRSSDADQREIHLVCKWYIETIINQNHRNLFLTSSLNGLPMTPIYSLPILFDKCCILYLQLAFCYLFIVNVIKLLYCQAREWFKEQWLFGQSAIWAQRKDKKIMNHCSYIYLF
jgi:hypothetical protein